MMKGYKLKEKFYISLHQQNLAVMRWVGSLIYNTNVKPAHRKSPEKLLKLPGDINIPQKPMLTKEQFMRAKKTLDKI